MFFKKKKIEIEKEIAFFWREDNFLVYDWPDYINGYPYTLSIFEREEKSFDRNVTKVFVEIADILTKDVAVLHIPESKVAAFSCIGIKHGLFQQQIDNYHGWDETELYCYIGSDNSSIIDKNLECDVYFMIDVIHANMTIKCCDKDLFQKAKNCMNEILETMNYNFEKWE